MVHTTLSMPRHQAAIVRGGNTCRPKKTGKLINS